MAFENEVVYEHRTDKSFPLLKLVPRRAVFYLWTAASQSAPPMWQFMNLYKIGPLRALRSDSDNFVKKTGNSALPKTLYAVFHGNDFNNMEVSIFISGVYYWFCVAALAIPYLGKRMRLSDYSKKQPEITYSSEFSKILITYVGAVLALFFPNIQDPSKMQETTLVRVFRDSACSDDYHVVSRDCVVDKSIKKYFPKTLKIDFKTMPDATRLIHLVLDGLIYEYHVIPQEQLPMVIQTNDSSSSCSLDDDYIKP